MILWHINNITYKLDLPCHNRLAPLFHAPLASDYPSTTPLDIEGQPTFPVQNISSSSHKDLMVGLQHGGTILNSCSQHSALTWIQQQAFRTTRPLDFGYVFTRTQWEFYLCGMKKYHLHTSQKRRVEMMSFICRTCIWRCNQSHRRQKEVEEEVGAQAYKIPHAKSSKKQTREDRVLSQQC